MKTLTSAIAAAAVVVGLGGGVATYALSAAPAENTDVVNASQTVEDTPSSSPSASEPKVKFKPCKAPTHREGKVCVEDVVQTVILPAPARSSNDHSRGSDDSGKSDDSGHKSSGHADDDDDRDEDHGDHDDDDDEDHEDEDHEDEDHPEPEDD